jgi:hypothetical protein
MFCNIQTQNDLHKTHGEDSAQCELLTLSNLEVPNQEDRKQTDDEILHATDSCDCYNDSAFIAAFQFVLESPGNVENVVESNSGRTCEQDNE